MIDAGSTAWVLVATALAQLMTPGLAFFYGGLMHEGSVLSIMMESFVSMGVVTVMWFLFVFSLCYGESVGGVIGNPATFFGMGNVSATEALVRGNTVVADGIPGLLYATYQCMFAVITPAIMTGTFADRFRFKPYLIFIMLWLLVVYAPWCHWIWGNGFLSQWGVYDYAGGIVVHTTAGFSALGSLMIVGHRADEIPEPHNVPFMALGTALLWFGWLGFNGGTAPNSSVAVSAVANTHVAAATCTSLWMLADWIRYGRPNLVGLCIGAVAGLATITPVAGNVQIWGAFVIGIVATIVCYSCCELLKKIGLDDALDVWGCHGMGGFIGAILLGALADEQACSDVTTAPASCINPGSVVRSMPQFFKQTVAAVACAIYSFVATWGVLQIMQHVIPIVPEKELLAKSGGLDLLEHGQKAYQSPMATTLSPQVSEQRPASHQWPVSPRSRTLT